MTHSYYMLHPNHMSLDLRGGVRCFDIRKTSEISPLPTTLRPTSSVWVARVGRSVVMQLKLTMRLLRPSTADPLEAHAWLGGKGGGGNGKVAAGHVSSDCASC